MSSFPYTRPRNIPEKVACDHEGCDFVDWPAWVEDHKRRDHPLTREGVCWECGGRGIMVVTPDGLFHRYGRQCDEERFAQDEARLMALEF